MSDALDSRARLLRTFESDPLAPKDFGARVGRLKGVADAMDPDWTWDFQTVGNTVVQTLRPQHSRAAQVSPISITLQGEFGPEDAELRDEFDRRLGYGAPGPITLPSRVVTGFEITGPPGFCESGTGVTVSFIPLGMRAAQGRGVTLTFFDVHGDQVALHQGGVEHIGSGDSGHTISVSLSHAVLPVTRDDHVGVMSVDHVAGAG